MKYRVFQSVRSLNVAGTEMVVMNWYRNIDRSQIQFDFGVNKPYHTPLVDEIKVKGGRILIIPESSGIISTFKYLCLLYKTLKANGPYIAFHAHEDWMSGLTCMVALLAGIKKRFVVSHYAQGVLVDSWRKKLFRPFSRLTIALFCTHRQAVSEDAGRYLYGNYLPYQIIHNGIDLQRFAYNFRIRQEKRKELQVEDKWVIGHVGRFALQKNHTFLIDVFAEIYKQNQQAHLVLLGIGELENSILKKVEKLEISKAVSFVGSQPDIQDFYQAFDVFVFPSLYEGLGIVAIEAQCSGLPCVMSDVIPQEAFVCNAKALSLKDSPLVWAQTILEMAKDFKRKDESVTVGKAGFDASEVGKMIQQEYLQ